ncbi:MAG: hypothetical protein ACYS5V_02685 [Planctomycetota bacterium]|jgi:hypothetical protein
MSALFEQISEWIDRNLGEGAEDGRAKYVLIGVLALIIVVCLAMIVGSLAGPGPSRGAAREAHYWCVETNKEFVFKPGEIPVEEMMQMEMADPYSGVRIKNPETGKQTLILMTRCPSCQKHFVTEAQKKAEPGKFVDPSTLASPVCTHCNTDVHQWYRQRHKNR